MIGLLEVDRFEFDLLTPRAMSFMSAARQYGPSKSVNCHLARKQASLSANKQREKQCLSETRVLPLALVYFALVCLSLYLSLSTRASSGPVLQLACETRRQGALIALFLYLSLSGRRKSSAGLQLARSRMFIN